MKKRHFIFIALILELFAFQNVYSDDLRPHGPLVLWRVYTKLLDSNNRMYVSVDSAFRGNLYIKEKFKITGAGKDVKLKPNAYYIVLAYIDCSQKSTKETCFLFLTEKDDLLSDTQENRELLNKKVEEKTRAYIDNSPGGARTKAEIFEVVNAGRPELDKIYKEYLKLKPDFSGKVTLKFSIATSGDIISTQVVGSTTDYPEFDNAIREAVHTWKWKEKKHGNQTPTIIFNFPEKEFN